MKTAAEIRTQLVEALNLDLVGPAPDDTDRDREILTRSPSKWYLTGFLAPFNAAVEQRSDETANENIDLQDRGTAGEDAAAPEAPAARPAIFPSSMGLSFLLSRDVSQLRGTVSWGDYEPVEGDGEDSPPEGEPAEGESKKKRKKPIFWQRTGHRIELAIPLSATDKKKRIDVPGGSGLALVISNRPVRSDRFPEGTRSFSVFLVNYRKPALGPPWDTQYAFQTQIALECDRGFVPRSDPRGGGSLDWDEEVAALQYRHDYEFAVGHNVSAIAEADGPDCRRICTTWVPTAEVPRVKPAEIPGAELGMEALADAGTAGQIREMVGPMVEAYATWIGKQQQTPLETKYQDIARTLFKKIESARQRIATGLDALEEPDVLRAFQIANRAIARARRQQLSQENGTPPEKFDPPRWRPFQLAFILLNLVGIADPRHGDREIVDLLFFPTGGGKTEAYLGLAAFALALRRLRHGDIGGCGVSVLMRYTLRLLTLDQLERATRLICALELERDRNPKLGSWPFEIGLWVGSAATPNKMGKKGDKDDYSARKKTLDFQRDSGKPSPIPLERCPWCGTNFSANCFQLLPDPDAPKQLRVVCRNRHCSFRGDRPLPIIAVDESIYRRLPCFIIATVDKFANLPWVGQTGALFGKVTRHEPTEGFYGPADPAPIGKAIDPLPPPDLVIQDELHLISGPLGTMVGLYETAIDALCSDFSPLTKGGLRGGFRQLSTPPQPSPSQGEGARSGTGADGKTIRPKVIASTATVRRAERQIKALFCRLNVDIFPPPGPDRHDSFFAETIPVRESPGRLYVGVAAQGRSQKVLLLRTYLALLATAQTEWDACGGAKNLPNPADPYMTLMGYFNSLRELGGSRRIVEDEIGSQLTTYSGRLRHGETSGPFSDRKIEDVPEELTSRVSTNEVATTKNRLSLPFDHKDRVDIVLATNMISVGLDIVRLGLMVVLGQPKTAAEYIQATSRVGRDKDKPGLVVTLLNIHRPRDRSHYERFETWHASFYRAVEATSVTPFSPRALDRGLAGVAVALSRLGISELTPPLGASHIERWRSNLEWVVETIFRRAEAHNPHLRSEEAEVLRREVRSRVIDLLDTWQGIAERETRLQYNPHEADAVGGLLLDAFNSDADKEPEDRKKFKAQRSLRDVEPTVNLWVCDPGGADIEGEMK